MSAKKDYRWQIYNIKSTPTEFIGTVTAPDEETALNKAIAELEIDPAHLEAYKVALKEEIDTSIRVEPGVLTLYAVSIKDDPTRIRIFETYADMDAYNAHVQSPHFLKYKTGTQHMIRSLTLIETDPIALGAQQDPSA